MEGSLVIGFQGSAFPRLMFLLSLMVLLSIPPALRAQDIPDLKQRAEQGDAKAQVELGCAYEKGKGVPQDYREAFEWYRKAAEQGNVRAQNRLGALYFQGKGVPRDYREAMKWFLKSLEMKPLFYNDLVFPCTYGVMALCLLAMGLRGMVTGRPFVYSARWFSCFWLIVFGPLTWQAVSSAISGDGSGISTALNWLLVAMVIGFPVFMSRMVNGYTVLGVTDTSFREGLLASLKKLNLDYDENMSVWRLPTIGADLQVAVDSWGGTANIKMKQRQFRGVLRDIAKNMNEYYRNSKALKVNLISYMLAVAMGVVTILFAGVFLFDFLEGR